MPAQWISIYNARRPMKQRYHYNVTDVRLSQHIEKGNEDGFTHQVYELSPFFLHKEWIMEQREKNYYISAIAGANNGSSLVVMSKGTQYLQQSYQRSRWAVVKSRGAGFSEQVVELDFLYPSDGHTQELGQRKPMDETQETTSNFCFPEYTCEGEMGKESLHRISLLRKNSILNLLAIIT
ncbi:hypothetical protein MLD38_005642 [Melastoma candidum]|uniref:Uncharacterized protein n=1 Tax=Melastoma candidum TaxID=119954 RepID=A0ACB9RTR7_9MYRT|nr:hypothetical protein MLD38_005642 [Melastoma candidum]